MIDTRQGDWNPTNFRFLQSETETDGATDPSVGGLVRRFRAGGTLNCGDVVCITAANTVTKNAVAATQVGRIGIVVGGQSTGMSILADKSSFTPATVQVAALINQPVTVLLLGVIWVVADGAIAAGGRIAPSTTTAGRVKAGGDFTATLGAMGIAIEVATTNGDVILAYIGLS